VHATPESIAVKAPLIAGVRCMLHAEPFHASASDICPPVAVSWLPTATQAVDEEQDTATSALLSTPGMFGVDESDHALPFQVSAKLPANDPIETQAVPDAQDTPLSVGVTNGGPDGGGVDSSCQVEPVNRSTTAPASVHPTALHADAVEHETPVICRMKVPLGLALGCTAHAEPFHCSARVTVLKLSLM
jgi:hypothetical protein